MKIYTGYYAKAKVVRRILPQAILIGISQTVPHWAGMDERCKILAPSDELRQLDKSEGLDDRTFRSAYSKELRAKKDVIKSLIDSWQARRKDVVLFCYEKQPGERACHRTILARWITREFGIDVREVDYRRGMTLQRGT